MNEQSKNKNTKDTRLDDQEQILNQYLESLLNEIPEYHEPETKAETEVKQETAEVITITPTSEVEVAPEQVQQEVVVEQVAALDEELEDLTEQEERTAPDWAQEPFQCLIFRVGDITLATPLLALDNIVKWETELTPMPFQPDWHLGVLQNRDDKVVVIDTAKLLQLEQSEEEEIVTRNSGSHVLIIGNHQFGLACDSLAKPLFLNKEDVHWTIKHEQRPWMAGTIREKLTILLDIDELLEIIRHE
jgi:purine-binding chemotaxis protein CheW